MNNKKTYDTITDWSLAGRRALVDARGAEIMWLLDEAVTVFMNDPEHSLTSCGFNKGDDPIMEYVEFCMSRFRDGDLDPELINPHDRSFRLFTRVDFWLSQKMGKQGYNALKKRRVVDEPFDDATYQTCDVSSLDTTHRRTQFETQLARTLAGFTRATVPELVSAWWWGAQRFLDELYGRREATVLPKTWSSSLRSRQIADAMCRFATCMIGLLPQRREDTEPMHMSYVEGCHKDDDEDYDHESYYRKLDKTVGDILGISSTDAKTQRKATALFLFEELIARARRAHEEGELLMHAFLRESLRKSFFDVHNIGQHDAAACRTQLDQWRTS